MKIYWVLILVIFLSGKNIAADNLYLHINSFCGLEIMAIYKEGILQAGRQRIEVVRKNYKPYECSLFKIGDLVTYSFYYVYFKKTDFVGVVTKIEPKPTMEYIHWITVQRLLGSGTSGIYSEQFLERYGM